MLLDIMLFDYFLVVVLFDVVFVELSIGVVVDCVVGFCYVVVIM